MEGAFDRISHHPIFGGGFRTATTIDAVSETGLVGAHSGWISALDELGTIGFIGFLIMYFGRGIELFQALQRSHEASQRTLYAMFLAGLAANIVPLTFQPNYINFGDPLGVIRYGSVVHDRQAFADDGKRGAAKSDAYVSQGAGGSRLV